VAGAEATKSSKREAVLRQLRSARPGFLIPICVVAAGTIAVLDDSLTGSDKGHLALAGAATVLLLLGCSMAPRRWLWLAVVVTSAVTIAWWLLVVVVNSG
jgi:hypothetical protein